MRLYKTIFKDSIVYGGADFLSKLIAFFSFPIIASALSPEKYGELELILTASSFIAIFARCGLSNSVQRYYWDKNTLNSERSSIVTTGLVIQLMSSIFILIISFTFLSNIRALEFFIHTSISEIALLMGLVLTLASQIIEFQSNVLRLHLAPYKFLFLSIFSRISTVLMGIISIIYFKFGLDGLLIFQSITMVFSIPLSILFVYKDINFSGITFQWIKKIIDFGHPFIYAELAFWFLASVDKIMLASLSNIEEVGNYSVAFRFASVVLFVSTAFGQAWSPIAVKIQTDNPSEYRRIYGNILVYLSFVMLSVSGFFGLFAGEIIGFIMPKVYFPAAEPMVIMCFGIAIQATQQITAIGISLEKKTFLFALLAIICGGINYLLNLILLPKYGSVGAAYSTTISYILLTSTYLYCTQKLHPLAINWKKILIILVGYLILFLGSIFNIIFYINEITVLIKISFLLVILLIIFIAIEPRLSLRKKWL